MSLAGTLQLWPGATGPTITSTRPQALVTALTRGRRADELPALLGALHTLCAHGHRLAATLAVRAALGQPISLDGAHRQALQLATARDQLLRLGHDWPRLLPHATGNGDGDCGDSPPLPLQSCPLWRGRQAPADRLAALPGWLQTHVLAQAPAHWLAAYTAEGPPWVLSWAARRATPLARLLDRHLAPALVLRTAVRPLQWPWPRAMPAQAVPDTGPWTRRHDTPHHPIDNAGMRLLSRLVDLLRLAASDGADWLDAGARSPAAGEGLAWVETARGLLVHRVVLAEGTDAPQVQHAEVRAPTDWNFHPRGVLAEALAHTRALADAQCLAVAFDPCVAFEIGPSRRPATEPEHA